MLCTLDVRRCRERFDDDDDADGVRVLECGDGERDAGLSVSSLILPTIVVAPESTLDSLLRSFISPAALLLSLPRAVDGVLGDHILAILKLGFGPGVVGDISRCLKLSLRSRSACLRRLMWRRKRYGEARMTRKAMRPRAMAQLRSRWSEGF
jgi:hypothetical protein